MRVSFVFLIFTVKANIMTVFFLIKGENIKKLRVELNYELSQRLWGKPIFPVLRSKKKEEEFIFKTTF